MTAAAPLLLHALSIANAAVWAAAASSSNNSVRVLVENRRRCVHRPRAPVSVIIPARNAAETLPRLLESLTRQKDARLRDVIVIDDDSRDDTVGAAEEYAALLPLRIIRNKEIPAGWAPKPYLYSLGLSASSGGILVLIDADTRLLDERALSILAGCAEATHGIASIAPRFSCPTRRCRLAETLLTGFSHAFLGFDKALDPRRSLAWFYGCCWAVERATYMGLGGPAAVRNELVEDKALARIAKRMGKRITVIWGPDLVETEWYGGIRETVEALSRILRTRRGKLFAASILTAISFYLPIVEALYAAHTGSLFPALLAAAQYIPQATAMRSGALQNRYSFLYAVAAPLAGMILSAGAARAARGGRILWRGRVL